MPYVLVVGDKEAEENTVNVNKRGVEDKENISIDDFVARIKVEDAKKIIF